MHTFIAYDCQKVQEQDLDPFEDLSLYTCSVDQLEQHLLQGDIDHSIMMASVAMALAQLRQSS